MFNNLPPSISCFLYFIPLYAPRSYPIQSPRPGCYGDREDSPGVRNYGTRSPDELFDVYCFAKKLQGESPPVKKKERKGGGGLGLVVHGLAKLQCRNPATWDFVILGRENVVGGTEGE